MSANNQTLIKEYKGKWYVFTNVTAESWCDVDENNNIIENSVNTLCIEGAAAVCDSRDEAYAAALKIDSEQGMFNEGTEYGVQFNRLCKDDAEVILKENERNDIKD